MCPVAHMFVPISPVPNLNERRAVMMRYCRRWQVELRHSRACTCERERQRERVRSEDRNKAPETPPPPPPPLLRPLHPCPAASHGVGVLQSRLLLQCIGLFLLRGLGPVLLLFKTLLELADRLQGDRRLDEVRRLPPAWQAGRQAQTQGQARGRQAPRERRQWSRENKFLGALRSGTSLSGGEECQHAAAGSRCEEVLKKKQRVQACPRRPSESGIGAAARRRKQPPREE